jgi:CBS domain-containing protein
MGVVELFNQIADNNFGFFQQVHVVADVMTAEPQTVSLDDTFEATATLMRRGKFHHAPVLDPDSNTIVGIISDRDLLRHQPRSLGTAAEGDDDAKVLQLNASRLMNREPVWCTRECSLTDAMTKMLEHHVDSVLVSADGKTPEGILTPRDFISTLLLYHRVCTRDFDLRRLRLVDLDVQNGIPLDEIFTRGAQTVRDVMTKDVTCLEESDKLSQAIELMQDQEIRHVPIVDGDGKLKGMLSDREVLKFLPTPDQLPETAGLSFRERLFSTDDATAARQSLQTVMVREPNSVTPETLLTDAMKQLCEDTISGLPVVDPKSNKLVGIVTTSDVLRVFRVVMSIGSR